MQWYPIDKKTPTDRAILAITDHYSDPYFAAQKEYEDLIKDPEHDKERAKVLLNTKMTLYAAHLEGFSHCEDGPNVIIWGGGWVGAPEGSLPDWWFQYGSDYEVVAKPILWTEIQLDSDDLQKGHASKSLVDKLVAELTEQVDQHETERQRP